MMRTLILLLMLFLAAPSGASTLHPEPRRSADTGWVLRPEKTPVKQGFLKKIVRKSVLKRATKALGHAESGDGRWLAVTGLLLGVLGVLSLVLIFYTGFAPALVLGLAGLLLSIFGLVRASQWQDTRLFRILAITGIVVSSLLLSTVLAVLLSGGL